jgi:hypothetical protein
MREEEAFVAFVAILCGSGLAWAVIRHVSAARGSKSPSSATWSLAATRLRKSSPSSNPIATAAGARVIPIFLQPNQFVSRPIGSRHTPCAVAYGLAHDYVSPLAI